MRYAISFTLLILVAVLAGFVLPFMEIPAAAQIIPIPILVSHASSLPPGTPTLDQNNQGACGAQCTGTPPVSPSISFSATGGTHIVIWILWCNNSSCTTTPATGDISSISDSTDTFVNKQLYIAHVSSSFYGMATYEVESAAGGSHPIQVTFGSGTTIYYATVLISSWFNIQAGDGFDTVGTGQATTANATCTTSGNLTQSNELVIGFAKTGGTVTAGNGTIINSGVATAKDEYFVGGTSGSTATINWTSAAAAYATSCAALLHN